jgi:hypothetical protein
MRPRAVRRENRRNAVYDFSLAKPSIGWHIPASHVGHTRHSLQRRSEFASLSAAVSLPRQLVLITMPNRGHFLRLARWD